MAISAWRAEHIVIGFPATSDFTPARKFRSREPHQLWEGRAQRALNSSHVGKMTGSDGRRFDRLGALERRAGETAVDIGAKNWPGRYKLKDIDPEMKIEPDHDIGRRESLAQQPRDRA